MNMSNKDQSCWVGNTVVVSVGARTGEDIVGAMLVAPEELGINMRERAGEGVSIGREALSTGTRAVVGSGSSDSSDELRRLLARTLGR